MVQNSCKNLKRGEIANRICLVIPIEIDGLIGMSMIYAKK